MATPRRASTRGTAKKRVPAKGAAKKRAPAKRAPAKQAPAKRRPPAQSSRRRARSDDRRREQLRKMRSKAGSRYRIHYDIDGPRVRLGLLWFAGAMIAAMLGPVGIGVYFAVAFGAASSHSARTWRARGHRSDPAVALVSTTVVVLAAIVAPWAMGLAIFGLVAVALAAAVIVDRSAGGFTGVVADAGLVLQTTLPAAVAGGCLVLIAGLETWAAVSLILLVSAYETGDYLIGSGSANAVEGPLAGGAAVFVVTLVVAALGFPPFGVLEAMVFGVVVAPLAFAGQLLASVILPHARAFAPALRRVDSLLLAAPVWYVGLDLFVV